MRALVVPSLLLMSLLVACFYKADDLAKSLWWAMYVANSFLFVHFAVNCHWVVLLNEVSANMWTLPKWSWRESRFLGWLIFIWLIAALGKMIAIMIQRRGNDKQHDKKHRG